MIVVTWTGCCFLDLLSPIADRHLVRFITKVTLGDVLAWTWVQVSSLIKSLGTRLEICSPCTRFSKLDTLFVLVLARAGTVSHLVWVALTDSHLPLIRCLDMVRTRSKIGVNLLSSAACLSFEISLQACGFDK